MSGRRSAGILLHRTRDNELQVLLVHPGGPLWSKRDLGAWQIPKGLIEPGEDEASAARREVEEELGTRIEGELAPLGEIRQAGGKVVTAFSLEHEFDTTTLRSNEVEIEWPPRSGRKIVIPEVNEARWFALDQAERHILPSQGPLLELLASANRTNPR